MALCCPRTLSPLSTLHDAASFPLLIFSPSTHALCHRHVFVSGSAFMQYFHVPVYRGISLQAATDLHTRTHDASVYTHVSSRILYAWKCLLMPISDSSHLCMTVFLWINRRVSLWLWVCPFAPAWLTHAGHGSRHWFWSPPVLFWGCSLYLGAWSKYICHPRGPRSPAQGRDSNSKPQALSPKFESWQNNKKAEIHPVGCALKEESPTPTVWILVVQALGHLVKATEVETDIYI